MTRYNGNLIITSVDHGYDHITEVSGYVDIRAEGVQLPALTKSGSVDIRAEGVQLPALTKSGSVYIRAEGALGERDWYGSPVNFRNVDGSTMDVGKPRKIGEVTVYPARYLKLPLNTKYACFVAEKEGYTAHGDSVREAIRDLRFKIAQENFDADELAEEIRERGTVTFNDYRLITGACESGLRHGLQERGIDPDTEELPLADVLRLCADGFGGEEFRSLFEEMLA